MWKFKRNIVNVCIGSNTCRHVKHRKDYVHEQRVGQNVIIETFQTAGHECLGEGTITYGLWKGLNYDTNAQYNSICFYSFNHLKPIWHCAHL